MKVWYIGVSKGLFINNCTPRAGFSLFLDTNAIDGGVFSPMKKLLKMVDDYLVSYKKK
ncbi:hypothetical protein [Sulfurimonas sp.]|uniref:hypothetical protein n=1 Tax=Sulfurimonas sp. TaxID=2022749 RepID=UPI002B47D75D|nr:hypothetical protein [Sulfurimonas sp.]